MVHVPPGIGCPFGVCAWHAPVPLRLSHQFPAPHSESVKHRFPHAPVATSQKGPACPAPHCASTVHTEQTPVARTQYGVVVEEHGLVTPVPLSPLQPTHVFVVGSQTGVVAVHVLERTHCSHLPALGPVVAQIIERHTVVPSPALQGPSPFL